MATVKNRAERAAETRQEKRERLTDPALADIVEQQREFQAANQTLQQGKRVAQLDMSDNLQRALADAIAAVRVATTDRDNSVNGRFRYDRNYKRMLQAAGQVVLQTGKSVDLPKYLPSKPEGEATTTVGPADFVQDTRYHESLGMGKSGKGGPVPNFAGDNDAWLNVQGAAK